MVVIAIIHQPYYLKWIYDFKLLIEQYKKNEQSDKEWIIRMSCYILSLCEVNDFLSREWRTWIECALYPLIFYHTLLNQSSLKT